MQLEWLWKTLALRPGMCLLDITCGPGLYAVEFARRGCQVTGIDFGPASISYARDLARSHGVSDRCTFVEQDIRQMAYQGADFNVALFTYGQLAVFPLTEAQALLANIAQSLRPGGKLCIELLDQAEVDKTNSTWWFTDDTGLWGERPFLHLGERVWHAAEQISVERFYIIHLETGELTEITLSDQTYAVETMVAMLKQAGFQSVDVHPAWGGLPLYDAEEWVVYVAER